MTEAIPPQDIEAALAYEDLHVASLFAEWAPRVLDAVRVGPGDDVLDVACGTGALTREAVRRVGEEGTVTGIDINSAMLEVAGRITPNATWRQGDATALPFEDAMFDAVVCQFGLMFFPNRVQAVREMVRVLRPGGRLALAVWDALEASPAYPIEVELLGRIAGPDAAEALRAPFVLGDTKELGETLESAGVGAIKISTIVGEARFPSLRSMVEADLRGWLPVMGVFLDEDIIQQVLVTAEEALARFVTEDGMLVFDSPAHVVTGIRT